MTPGARITAGLLAAVVVVSLAYLVRQQASGPDDYLLAGEQFSPTELYAMETAFGKAGLGEYVVDGGRVRIQSAQRAAYMAALADGNALPEHFGSYFRKAIDQGGMFIGSQEKEERMKLALQEELAAVIRGMRDIERAAVFYDVKTKRGLSSQTVATASVIVKPKGTQQLDEQRVSDIRHVVAHAIGELKPQHVSVSDQNGRTYPATGESASGIDSNEYRQMKLSYEADLRKTILDLLSMVPGALVSVNVALDPEMSRETVEKKYDKAVSAATTIDERQLEETNEASGSNGPPGTRSNGSTNEPANIAVTAAKGNNSLRTRTDSKQTIQPGGSESIARLAGLTPKRVTVSVGVPKSYFEKIWRKNTGADETQKADDNAIATIQRDETQKLQR
ncbi:MAG: hypothetical protein WD176_05565, partial [Pirellulales bacterium]